MTAQLKVGEEGRDTAGEMGGGQTVNYANSKGQPLKDFKQKGEGILSLLLFPEPNPILKTSWETQ